MAVRIKKPVQKSGSMADQAYTRIRDLIVSLELPPGSPLYEDRLSTELGIGRTPIREAIKRLALESLIDVYPRRGTFVSDVQLTDLGDVSEVRVILESHAAGLAAERLRRSDQTELERLLKLLDRAGDLDIHQLIDLDSEIHRFIYAAARNRYLQDTLERYFNLSARVWHLALDRLPPMGANVIQHRELLEAIETGDAEAARRIAADHVETFERAIREAL